MAEDTIEVLKVLFSKKALINGKSSEYKKRFWKIYEEEIFCRPLDRNFAFFTESLTSNQSVRSVRVTQVTINIQYSGSSVSGENLMQ